MAKTDPDVDRRKFLKATTAGSVVGMTALAGCGGGGGTDTETETDTEADDGGGGNDGGDDDPTEGGGGGEEMGDQLPSYTYLNNPANYNAARHDAINLIGSQLEELGLDVDVEVFEWGTLFQRATQEFEFGLTTWNRGLGIYPGTRLPEQFHSSNTGPGQGNFTGYVNEDLDPMLTEQLTVADVDERVDMLHEIQTVLAEDVPMHPIVQMPGLVAYNNQQVEGFTDTLAGYYHFEPMTNVEVTADHGELRGSWSETLGTLNVMGYNNESKLIQQFEVIYDKLVRNNSELEADPELSLATEWERPDAETVRYKIREGHTWHDGEDVTPEDVVFTLNYIKEQQIPLYTTQHDLYDEGAVEQDGQWVQVNFNQAVGPVHQTFSNQIPIIPQHIWSERDDPNNTQVTAPVGSGPMEFDYWDEGSELSLVKNEDHWRPVNFDRRIWRIIPESSTVWSLLLDGELNYLPFSRLGRQLSQNAEKSQVTVQSTPGDGWWHISPNQRREGLDDPAVRQAIMQAVPKSTINDQLLYGYAKPGWNLIGESFGQYSNPDVPKYQGNVEDGMSILEEAGYVFDDDGNVHFPAE